METVVCQACEKPFQDSHSNSRHFCSRECYWEDLKKRKPWNHGKAGTYHHSEAAKKGKREVMKRLYAEGKRIPPCRRPHLLVSHEDNKLLHSLYVENGLSARKIAKRLHCSDVTILRRLRFHGIQIRSAEGPGFKSRQEPSEKTMRKHVVEKFEAPVQNWVFGVPCFSCQLQTHCSENSLGLPSPANCSQLETWLLGLTQQNISFENEKGKVGEQIHVIQGRGT